MFDYFRDELSKLKDDVLRYVIQTATSAGGPATTFVVTTNGDCIECENGYFHTSIFSDIIERTSALIASLRATILSFLYS